MAGCITVMLIMVNAPIMVIQLLEQYASLIQITRAQRRK